MYGYEAQVAQKWLRSFGHDVSYNVRYWSRSPAMVEASVARSFESYHYWANKLRKAVNVAKKDFNNSSFKGFVNVSLSPEQKEAYADWDIQDSDVWDGLASYGERGYKFSLSYNKGNENWIATYTGTDDAGKNSGYAVTGFAGDPYNAARVLLFKVSCVLPDVWKEYKPLPSDTIG